MPDGAEERSNIPVIRNGLKNKLARKTMTAAEISLNEDHGRPSNNASVFMGDF